MKRGTPTPTRRGIAARNQALWLLGIDATIIALGLTVAFQWREHVLWFRETLYLTPALGALGVAIAVIWVLCIAAFSGYSSRQLGAGTPEFSHLLMASATAAGLVGITAYLLQYQLSRGFYVLLFAITTPLLVLGRWRMRRFIHRLHVNGEQLSRVLLVGDAHHVSVAAQVLDREKWLGYEVVGALSPTTDWSSRRSRTLTVLGISTEVAKKVAELELDVVIFTEGSYASVREFRRMIWELEPTGVQVFVVPALTEVAADRITMRPVGGLPLVQVDRSGATAAARFGKRMFDVLGAGLLLLAASPVMALVALAIRFDDGGPVLFSQIRTGKGGLPFTCYKFRSMAIDAEARLAELQAHNMADGPLFKMAADPRITRVGRFIRHYSLDELPQLWNVLCGDMSLVGPRPPLPSEVEKYDADVLHRLTVRPGLTGLWQISGRSDLNWEETIRLDLYYVDNWSVVQDLLIVARTAKAVLRPSGAY